MTAATLRAEQLGKRFGGLQVFTGIDFELKPGNRLGVIGPNGAGKTTLINVLSGLLPPSAGQVTLDGKRMSGLPLHALSRLGVVRSFQQTTTFKRASVRENLSRALRFSRAPGGASDRLDAMLRQFD